MSPVETKTIAQPQPSVEMCAMNNTGTCSKQECKHNHKASRLRGGGAAKDCFLGALECFLCFECCKVCCECCADIICCPCEMCCG